MNGNSGSLFTNSNWFAFEDDRGASSLTSPSDNTADDAPAHIEKEEQDKEEEEDDEEEDTSDEVVLDHNDKVTPLLDDDMETIVLGNGPTKETNEDDSVMPESSSIEPEEKLIVPNGVLENETMKEDVAEASPDPGSNKKDEVADIEKEASPKMEPQVGNEVSA